MAECDAALGWVDHAAELEPFCARVFPGVALPLDREARIARQAPPNATWADYLHDCRFHDGAMLAANVAWWLDTFARRQISVVVGDYAPCALMAAQIAGIPALAVGTGYGIPPAHLAEFPVFLADHPVREADEAALVAGINAALGPLGLPEMTRLPQVYRRSADLLRTLPMLDPYAAHRTGHAYLPPVADYAGISEGTGTEMFCYFSTREFENPALVEALASCGLPLRCFLPAAPAGVRERLLAAGAAIEDRPVPVQDIARRSRMVFNSGQHGILCLSLAAGLPQLCLPQHLEQLYHARRAEQAGVARVIPPGQPDAATIRAAMLDLWHDTGPAAPAGLRARALAAEVAPQFRADDAPLLREHIAPWL
jgi:hypothetical protein